MKKASTTKRVLAFLREYIGQKDYAPSIREIARCCGLPGTATVWYHLNKLAWAGVIRRDSRVARSIVLVGRQPVTCKACLRILAKQ